MRAGDGGAMRSTTVERLALCRAMQPPPEAVQRVVEALWRVTHMRVRLMTRLVAKKGWPVPTAKDFVQANGSVWR